MSKEILIVTSEFPPMPGGIGNHAFCLAKQLSYLKYSVTVMTEQRESQPGDWQNLVNSNKNLNIVGIYRRRIIIFTYFLRFLCLYGLIRRVSFKAVIYSGKFSVLLNALMPRTKSIVVVHGSEIKQSAILRFFFERGLKRAEYIVCVSKYTKSQLVSQYKELDQQKIVVINNGFQKNWNDDKLSNRNFKKNRLNLVTVGGIHKRKGQFNVIRALPEIIKYFPDVKYHIVGLPVEKDELLNIINNENVQRQIIFYHELTDFQLKEVLTESDVFMMLSEHLENGDFEGFGIAIIEAMTLGLPAVGTRNSGIADAVKDGFSGKLVDPKNTGEILSAIREITVHYNLYSKNARKWADSFQWKYKVKEYKSLIDKL